MSESTKTAVPRAAARPATLTAHGDDRVDPYFWLRDRDDPEVTAYLEAENEFTEAGLAHTQDLQQKLYEEIVARVLETDMSAPVRKGEWWYYTRTVEGLQYGINCRKHGLEGDEHVLLDQNAEAEGHEFFAVGVFDVSPDQQLLAYGTDTTGGEKYTVRFKNLNTGELLDDVIEDVYYGSAWSTENRTFFYTRVDDAMRPYQVWRHTLGAAPAEDVLVYQEDDDAFFLDVHLERDEQVIIIHAGTKVTDEVRYLPADDPAAAPVLIQPRIQDLEYSVSHHTDGVFFIVTNHEAVNSRLMKTPVASPGIEHWTEVVPHRDDVKLSGVDVFKHYLALYERADALQRIRVMRLADGDTHTIDQPEPVYTAGAGANAEFDTAILRYGYTSLVTPTSTYDYDIEAGTRELIKQQPVLGGYDAEEYVSERLWATAPDGEQVPISVVRRRDVILGPDTPCQLYGYGSYEHSIDPTFSSVRLNLVDRGFVFAIAHIRGGGEKGRGWYDHGKMLEKRNTFTDFIACAEHLIAEGYTSADRLVIRGGSAGGLLMGAVINLRPDLFKAVVAQVPFVDCLTTILDETLPLTVIEWEEWGNPKANAEVYAYMKAYSPYDNVAAKNYPAMLVTAGLNDPRVSYWEPAKWVAKLRATKTDDNPLLLKTEMGAGHQGPSGRYDAWREEALVHAFILDTLGISG